MAEGQSQDCSLFCIYWAVENQEIPMLLLFYSSGPSGSVTQSSAMTKPHVLSC